MKNEMKNYSLLIVLVMFFGLIFSFANAQEAPSEENFLSDQEEEFLPEEDFSEDPLPPFVVEIDEASYLEETSQAQLNIMIDNNTEDFVSGLYATLNVYKGDKLKESGYILEGTEKVYSVSKEIQDFAPGQQEVLDLRYDLPNNLGEGNYFYKLGVADRDLKHIGMFLLRDPIKINGEGGFLSIPYAGVRVDGEDFGIFAGPPLKSDESMFIFIPLEEENTGLKEMLDQQDLYMQATVEAISGGEYSKKLDRIKVSVVNNEVLYTLEPQEAMPTGSFTVFLKITDSDNNPVAGDILARWFRSERLARVTEVKTGTNYYEKGDSLDVDISAVFTGFPDGEPLDIVVSLKSGSKSQEFKKEYLFSNEKSESQSFSFDGKVASEDLSPDLIEVSIVDRKTGKIIDKYILTTSGNGKYVEGKILEGDKTTGDNQEASREKIMLSFIAVLAFLMIVALVFYIVKDRRGIKSIIFLFILVSFAMLYGVSDVFASLDRPSNTWATWSSRDSGNQGTCPDNRVGIENLYIHLSCSTCLNGMSGYALLTAYRNGSSFATDVAGFGILKHVYSGKTGSKGFDPQGPYDLNFKITNPSASYKYKVKVKSNNGSHCFGSSRTYGYYGVSCSVPTSRPKAVIDIPATDPAEYTIGDNVDFTGRGILGSGGGSIDQYAWINVRSGTPSYDNKNKCAFVDTVDTNSDGSFNSSDALRRVDTNATSDSFSTSTLPLGTHRVCLNVRQEYNDGSTSWAGSNVAFRDIVIKEPPCTYSCGAPQSETPQACEESDCNGGAGCGAGYECAGNKAYQKNKTFCYESACGSNLVDNSNCGGSCNPSGVTEPATCACEANQGVNNWIEVPAGN